MLVGIQLFSFNRSSFDVWEDSSGLLSHRARPWVMMLSGSDCSRVAVMNEDLLVYAAGHDLCSFAWASFCSWLYHGAGKMCRVNVLCSLLSSPGGPATLCTLVFGRTSLESRKSARFVSKGRWCEVKVYARGLAATSFSAVSSSLVMEMNLS